VKDALHNPFQTLGDGIENFQTSSAATTSRGSSEGSKQDCRNMKYALRLDVSHFVWPGNYIHLFIILISWVVITSDAFNGLRIRNSTFPALYRCALHGWGKSERTPH